MWRHFSIVVITRALWHYTRQKRPVFYALYAVNIADRLVSLGGPYILGQIVNTLQEHGKAGISQALEWVALFAVVQISAHGMHALVNFMTLRLGHHLNQTFKKDFYYKIQALPLLWHQDHHSGNLTSRLYKASDALSKFVDLPLQFIGVLISFGGTIVILSYITPLLGLITFIMSMATLFISHFFIKKIKKATLVSSELNHTLSATLTDYIGNIRSIVTLRLGRQTIADLNRRVGETDRPNRTEATWRSRRDIGVDFFVETITISCIAYLIFSFGNVGSLLKIGTVVMVITYLRDMSSSIYEFNRLYRNTSQAVTDYEGFKFVADAYDDHSKRHPISHAKATEWQTISVQNLQFSYQGNLSRPSLDDLSITMKRGQKIALVGASGGGKSTLMTVLRGLYPAQYGLAIIDGVAFDSVAPLSAISTLIPQDPEIFENTIRYNITLGVEHTDDEIRDACRIACFDTVLDTLPHGLDSRINEKGVNLSGGQKQRLALARGIFAIRESSLVLFDEPTSSVDAVTERRLYQNLFAAFPDICLISSIHRLNLLSQFDTIWVMAHGRLVQQGALEDLINQTDEPFHALWSAHRQVDE